MLKLVKNAWKSCKLENADIDFMEVYKSLPYELDANLFAYQKTKEVINNDSEELKSIFNISLPNKKLILIFYKKFLKK